MDDRLGDSDFLSRLLRTPCDNLVIVMKTIGLALLIFGLSACGGSSSATTSVPSTDAATAGSATSATSAPTITVTAGLDLAGIAFEVHQEPG